VGVERLELSRCALGDSIAVAGVCLTVVSLGASAIRRRCVAREPIADHHRLDWEQGRHVNLELPLRVGDALGGHWLAGHVDGIAEILARTEDARSLALAYPRAAAPLQRYVARKGSVAIDGVSLTVNASRAGVRSQSGAAHARCHDARRAHAGRSGQS
jgi:riboflavin synthase